MERINDLVEALITYLNKPTSNQWTEVISIVATFLSLGGVIFVCVYTVRKNTKLQNANARIEWIQRVRNVTAELISTYYSVLNEDDANEILKKIIEAREKVELLMLFFGPEKYKTKKACILSEDTNDGKNDLIIEYLRSLSDDFEKYYKRNQKETLPQATARVNRALNKLQNNITSIISEEYVDIGNGQTAVNIEYSFTPEIESEVNEAQKNHDEIKKSIDGLDNKLCNLRNIMRIYLKNEWNKAKKGK